MIRLLAAASLSMGLFSAAAVRQAPAPVSADTPDRYLTAGPPLADIAIAKYPGLALGDLDGDGDPDALAADFLGQTIFYRNGGGPNTGASFFREALGNYPGGLYIDTGAQTGTRYPTNPHPELYDYDHDGDLDLFIGTFNQRTAYGGANNSERPTILYFENIHGYYQFYLNNPISKIPSILGITARWVTVAVGDLNNDRLPDAVVSYFETTSGILGYYRMKAFLNNASGIPTMMNPSPMPAPCMNDAYATKASPRLVDIDKDGLLDLFVGCEDGTVEFYENTGTLSAPAFTQRKGAANPLNPPGSTAGLRGPDVGRDAVPAFADMDGDRILDASIVNGAGLVTYYRNNGTRFAPQFNRQQDMPSPLGGLDTGGKDSIDRTGGSALSFGDLDNDGDQDAVAGGYNGKLHLYLNSGTSTNPQMDEPASLWGFPRPVVSSGITFNAVPKLVDIDDDEDLDIFVTYMPENPDQPGYPDINSLVAYYQNNGNPGAPNFVLQAVHAMSGLLLPENAVLTFGDIDSDGDLDALVGSQADPMQYFENTGDHEGPVFEEKSGTENPMDGVAIQFGAPELVDVDGDGLLDCMVGEGRLYTDSGGIQANGSVHYYHNTGDSDAPVLTETSSLDNPFSGLNSGSFATPALADLDGDSDLDFFSGSGFGTFMYSRNVGTRRDMPAYRDYQFNPLSNVQPQDINNPHAISINLGDVDTDGDQDAFIGTAVIGGIPSEFLYYMNAGTNTEPVFRLQDDANNPLRDIQSSTSLMNVSFADTSGDDGVLEAYVGSEESAAGVIKYYTYDDLTKTYIEDADNNPFPADLPLDYQIGPRINFFDRTGNYALDAYIMRGYTNNAYGVYYAENLGSISDPDFPVDIFNIDSWLLDSTTNPFYYANEAHTIETGMNGTFVDASTVWVGNYAGEMYTMMPCLVDPATHADYMARIPSKQDPFKGIYLPSPTIPAASDINFDTFMDAFVAASDGRIHFFRGTDTPPPVPNDVFLPLVTR